MLSADGPERFVGTPGMSALVRELGDGLDVRHAVRVTAKPAVARAINKPYGIAVKDGVAYVCDTKGLSICRLDFRNRSYSIFGVRGAGRLRKPINIAMDSLGYKFVADAVRHQMAEAESAEDKASAARDLQGISEQLNDSSGREPDNDLKQAQADPPSLQDGYLWLVGRQEAI